MKRRLFTFLPFVGAAMGHQFAVGTTGIDSLMTSVSTKPFQCNYCHVGFHSKAELDAHECTFHVENGRCPVCGQMAKPWKRPVHGEGEIDSNVGTLAILRYYPVGTPYGPTSRQERCSRCNASFWTDGEKD